MVQLQIQIWILSRSWFHYWSIWMKQSFKGWPFQCGKDSQSWSDRKIATFAATERRNVKFFSCICLALIMKSCYQMFRLHNTRHMRDLKARCLWLIFSEGALMSAIPWMPSLNEFLQNSQQTNEVIGASQRVSKEDFVLQPRVKAGRNSFEGIEPVGRLMIRWWCCEHLHKIDIVVSIQLWIGELIFALKPGSVEKQGWRMKYGLKLVLVKRSTQPLEDELLAINLERWSYWSWYRYISQASPIDYALKTPDLYYIRPAGTCLQNHGRQAECLQMSSHWHCGQWAHALMIPEWFHKKQIVLNVQDVQDGQGANIKVLRQYQH